MLREVVPHAGPSDADPHLAVRRDAGRHTGHRFADHLDAIHCTTVHHVAEAQIVTLQAGSSSAAPHTVGRHIADRVSSLTAWNEAYIMLVSCIDYALDMTCIQSVSQCFIVGGIL